VKAVENIPEVIEIDEEKIDTVLAMLQNADPTGETNPDPPDMVSLEEQSKGMGPLIDAELEIIDRKHVSLMELNTKLMESLQMYHDLMKEQPIYSYGSINKMSNYSAPASSMMMPGAPNTQMMTQAPYMMAGMAMAPSSQAPGVIMSTHSMGNQIQNTVPQNPHSAPVNSVPIDNQNFQSDNSNIMNNVNVFPQSVPNVNPSELVPGSPNARFSDSNISSIEAVSANYQHHPSTEYAGINNTLYNTSHLQMSSNPVPQMSQQPLL